MQRVFITISILCLLAAAFFLFVRGNLETTFVVATVGVVAYFLSVRTKLKATNRENEEIDLQEDEN